MILIVAILITLVLMCLISMSVARHGRTERPRFREQRKFELSRAETADVKILGTLLVSLALSACAGPDPEHPNGNGSSDKATPVQAPPPAASIPLTASAAGTIITPPLVALGDSIFHGQVAGGTCVACHGVKAKGTAAAPDLTDSEWHNGDGSYGFIVMTVTNGVSNPMEYPAAMPPKGGAALTEGQVRAVAAYVFSLRRGGS